MERISLELALGLSGPLSGIPSHQRQLWWPTTSPAQLCLYPTKAIQSNVGNLCKWKEISVLSWAFPQQNRVYDAVEIKSVPLYWIGQLCHTFWLGRTKCPTFDQLLKKMAHSMLSFISFLFLMFRYGVSPSEQADGWTCILWTTANHKFDNGSKTTELEKRGLSASMSPALTASANSGNTKTLVQ